MKGGVLFHFSLSFLAIEKNWQGAVFPLCIKENSNTACPSSCIPWEDIVLGESWMERALLSHQILVSICARQGLWCLNKSSSLGTFMLPMKMAYNIIIVTGQLVKGKITRTFDRLGHPWATPSSSLFK